MYVNTHREVTTNIERLTSNTKQLHESTCLPMNLFKATGSKCHKYNMYNERKLIISTQEPV